MLTKHLLSYRVVLSWVISLLFLYASCGKNTGITPEQVDRWIDQNAPVGSTKDEVIAFLESSTIDSIHPQHYGFVGYPPTGTDARGAQDTLSHGYLVAVLRNVGHDQSKFQVYRIRIVFYFGEDHQLIDHQTKMLGDW